MEAADLEQAVWVRWLERGRAGGPPPDPARWLRAAARAKVRGARRRARREAAYDPAIAGPVCDPAHGTEQQVLRAEQARSVRAAVGRLPGRCPAVLAALLSRGDPTYPETARTLGISQGSSGPIRSRCVARLRRMLTAEVAAPERGGRVR